MVLGKAGGASDSNASPWYVLGQVTSLWVSNVKWKGMVESPIQAPRESWDVRICSHILLSLLQFGDKLLVLLSKANTFTSHSVPSLQQFSLLSPASSFFLTLLTHPHQHMHIYKYAIISSIFLKSLS